MSSAVNILPVSAIKAVVILMALIVFCLPIAKAANTSPAEWYKAGNEQYKAGHWEDAATNYEKLLAGGHKKAEVYYNLGNCYYKLDQTGKAILNYERALNAAPGDEDIQHNLKLANLKTIDKIQPVPQLGFVKAWNSFVSSNTSKGWAMLALLFIWAAFVAFAIYVLMNMRRFIFPIGVLLLLLSVSAGLLAAKQNGIEKDSDVAILTISNVYAKSAPDENGSDIFMIHEGIKFQVLDQVGNWEKIRLADGRVGWIGKESFEKI